MYDLFDDRKQAGELLAKRFLGQKLGDVLVIAIPRGGVVVGAQIANALKCALDIVAPRKLSAPDNSELAIGAAMHDGSNIIDEQIVQRLQIPNYYIEKQLKQKVAESKERMEKYRQNKSTKQPNVTGKTIILADDGIATGATALVAMRWLRKQNPNRIILATPVIAPDVLLRLRKEKGVEIVFLQAPEYFAAIGQFYKNFEQVEDEEVLSLLNSN